MPLLRCWALTLLIMLSALGCGVDTQSVQAPVGQLRLGAVLGETDLSGYALADRVRPFSFPADHGPHPRFRSEWWYLTLILEDAEARPIGVQFTLFRQALAPARELAAENRWQTSQAYLAHFAITDVAGAVHRVEERYARGHPQLAGVIIEPFRLWLEDWQITSDGDQWRLSAGGSEYGVDLLLDMNVPPVLQGDRGLSRKGENQASYYYSMPGLAVAGHARLDGVNVPVSGLGWLDREWSTSLLSADQIGWDWFALQLDDQRRVMMFQLRHRNGSRDEHDQGMVVRGDGSSRPLTVDDFSLTPVRFWTDEEGVSWPVAWSVQLGDEVWRVEAALDDQQMETTIRYWEGLVVVSNAAGEAIGRGYLELTGYSREESSGGKKP